MELKHHVFVCTSCRQNGQQKGMCFNKGANEIVMKFQEAVDENELSDDVLVTNCGCFGYCTRGPVAVVYPEGVFYGGLSVDDVEEIVESHLGEGKPVERLVIK